MKIRIIIGVGLLLIILLAAAGSALAQTGGAYDLSWNVQPGGGQTFSTGGPYSLGSTIGQVGASGPMTGGVYSLSGGFWAGIPGFHMYVPIVKK